MARGLAVVAALGYGTTAAAYARTAHGNECRGEGFVGQFCNNCGCHLGHDPSECEVEHVVDVCNSDNTCSLHSGSACHFVDIPA